MVRDEWIPGTLNVGTSVPVAIEAFAFVAAIAVDPMTLLIMVPLGALGGFVGAAVVAGLPRRPIQLGMGLALLTGAPFDVPHQHAVDSRRWHRDWLLGATLVLPRR